MSIINMLKILKILIYLFLYLWELPMHTYANSTSFAMRKSMKLLPNLETTGDRIRRYLDSFTSKCIIRTLYRHLKSIPTNMIVSKMR